MNWDISIHGDITERENSEFIGQNLPFYSRVWELYIGNNGTNNLAEIKSISDSENLKRKKVALYLYTCFESIILIKYIITKIVKINTLDDYLNNLNNHLAFQANMGRIRDNAKKLDDVIEIKRDTETIFKSFWMHRNTTLHEIKLPYSIFDNEFLISLPDNFNKDLPPQFEKSLEFEEQSIYYNNSFADLINKFNGFLGLIYDNRCNFMKKNNLKLENPPNSKVRNNNYMMPTTSYIDFDELYANFFRKNKS